MLFRRISLTNLLPCISSSASSPTQLPSQVISLFVARFFTSSSSSGNTGSGCSGFSSRYRQQDEPRHDAKVSVWWDFEDCKIPRGVNWFKVAPAIANAIRSKGIKGPINITAYLDSSQLSKFKKRAVSSTGVYIRNIFRGMLLAVDEILLQELIFWVSENPPPAHLFIISSDRDFARTLHKLRMSNYNILLASNADAHGILRSAATIMWDWCAMVKGENVIGRHFNQPPDGPFNSWYGHDQIPLQDPFAVVEQSNSVKIEESPASNSNLDSEVRFFPTSSFKQPLDGPSNAWYGHYQIPLQEPFAVVEQSNSMKIEESAALNSNLDSKVSFFPSSSFDSVACFFGSSSSSYSSGSGPSSGYSFVRCLQQDEKHRNIKVFVWWNFDDCNLPASANGLKVAQAIIAAVRSNGIKGPITITAFGDLSLLSKINREALSSMGIDLIHVSRAGKESAHKALLTDLMRWVSLNPPPAHLFFISSDLGLGFAVQILSMRRYNMLIACKGDASSSFYAVATIMWDWCSLVKAENVTGILYREPPSTGLDLCWYGSYKIPRQGLFAVEDSNSLKTEESPSSTPSDQRFGEKDATAAKLAVEPRGARELGSDSSQMDEIFITESFWAEIEAFVNSHRGSTIISEKKSREGVAGTLRVNGPLCVKRLSDLDRLHLVNALISKKWIEEGPNKNSRFRVPNAIKKPRRVLNRGGKSGRLRRMIFDCQLWYWS